MIIWLLTELYHNNIYLTLLHLLCLIFKKFYLIFIYDIYRPVKLLNVNGQSLTKQVSESSFFIMDVISYKYDKTSVKAIKEIKNYCSIFL